MKYLDKWKNASQLKSWLNFCIKDNIKSNLKLGLISFLSMSFLSSIEFFLGTHLSKDKLYEVLEFFLIMPIVFAILTTFFLLIGSLTVVATLKLGKASGGDFYIHDFDNEIDFKNSIKEYDEILNVIATVGFIKNKFSFQFVSQLQKDLTYNKVMLKDKEIEEFPQEIQKKLRKNQKSLFNALKICCETIYQDKLYEKETFINFIEKQSLAENLSLLESLCSKKPIAPATQNEKEMAEIKELEKIAQKEINKLSHSESTKNIKSLAL